jgi:DNA-binding MarR family transcriptional regulator
MDQSHSKSQRRRVVGTGATLDFVAMHDSWRSHYAGVLNREDPGTILQLYAVLELANGISQTQLQQKVKVKQSRLSKLLAKLIAGGEIRVEADPYDSRLRILRLTDLGRSLFELFEPSLPRPSLDVLAKGGIRLKV